jgi:hypothetical protein
MWEIGIPLDTIAVLRRSWFDRKVQTHKRSFAVYMYHLDTAGISLKSPSFLPFSKHHSFSLFRFIFQSADPSAAQIKLNPDPPVTKDHDDDNPRERVVWSNKYSTSSDLGQCSRFASNDELY